MKKNTALWTVALLITLPSIGKGAMQAFRCGELLIAPGDRCAQAPPQEALAPRWQSREEYDAFMAIENQANNPEAQIALSQAFLQRFPASDFKSDAYLIEMTSYHRLNDVGRAVIGARNALRFDQENLAALSFLSYVFPFTFRSDDRNANSILRAAKDNAQRGLNVLKRTPKPPNVSNEQLRAYVMRARAIFNDALGFVALQQKDYGAAIAALRAAATDNPLDRGPLHRGIMAGAGRTHTTLDVNLAKSSQDQRR